MKRIAILQPSYLPWLGFFEQLYKCDIFVFLDDVQFTKNDWRNRNRIKTKDGIQWLTVPVLHQFGQKIKDTFIDNKSNWQKKHLQSLKTWYGASKYFKDIISELEIIYTRNWTFLVDIDTEICLWLKDKLGIHCDIVMSSDLNIQSSDRQYRLIEICKTLNCNDFYEGKSGQNYINVELFRTHRITVQFQDYSHPYYNQLWIKEQGFISHLSIIDLLFTHGQDTLDIITGRKAISKPMGVRVRHADEVRIGKE